MESLKLIYSLKAWIWGFLRVLVYEYYTDYIYGTFKNFGLLVLKTIHYRFHMPTNIKVLTGGKEHIVWYLPQNTKHVHSYRQVLKPIFFGLPNFKGRS
jgi:hypothetical protein